MGTAKGPIDNISEREFVSLKEARGQVETAITRIALLHLAFSRTLVEEFGAEKGRSGKTLIRDSCEERGEHRRDTYIVEAAWTDQCVNLRFQSDEGDLVGFPVTWPVKRRTCRTGLGLPQASVFCSHWS